MRACIKTVFSQIQLSSIDDAFDAYDHAQVLDEVCKRLMKYHNYDDAIEVSMKAAEIYEKSCLIFKNNLEFSQIAKCWQEKPQHLKMQQRSK